MISKREQLIYRIFAMLAYCKEDTEENGNSTENCKNCPYERECNWMIELTHNWTNLNPVRPDVSLIPKLVNEVTSFSSWNDVFDIHGEKEVDDANS